MCRYHRVVVSWRPTNKASREHVHDLTFDVRSFCLRICCSYFGTQRFLERNSLDWVSLCPIWVVNLLIFPTVCHRIFIKMTRIYKELLSSLQGSIGSNLPYDPCTHKESRVCYFGWIGRCYLYPLVSWCNCWWLGTVSFTINLSFLQLKAPSIQSGSHFLGWHTTCSYRWVKRRPQRWRWIQDTIFITSSGLAVVRCFPRQVHRVIPTPLSQAKGTHLT